MILAVPFADEAVFHFISFAKKALTFLRISFSMRSSLFSRRSQISSVRSSAFSLPPPWLPAPDPPSSAAVVFTHIEVSAAFTIEHPCSVTKATAPCLNSGVNSRRLLSVVMFHLGQRYYHLSEVFGSI